MEIGERRSFLAEKKPSRIAGVIIYKASQESDSPGLRVKFAKYLA